MMVVDRVNESGSFKMKVILVKGFFVSHSCIWPPTSFQLAVKHRASAAALSFAARLEQEARGKC